MSHQSWGIRTFIPLSVSFIMHAHVHRTAFGAVQVTATRAQMKKILVTNWMTLNPVTIGPRVTIPEAQKLMKERKIRRLPVVDHGRLVGIVTLGDIRGAEPSEASTLSIFEAHYLLAKLTTEKIMTWEPITIRPDATIQQAAQLMLEHKIGGLPVVDNDKLVGIITESDIFRVLAQEPEAKQA